MCHGQRKTFTASINYFIGIRNSRRKGSKSSIAVPSYGLREVNALVFLARVVRVAATGEQQGSCASGCFSLPGGRLGLPGTGFYFQVFDSIGILFKVYKVNQCHSEIPE